MAVFLDAEEAFLDNVADAAFGDDPGRFIAFGDVLADLRKGLAFQPFGFPYEVGDVLNEF